MLNRFCKKPLYEVTGKLAAVAMGREPADLVISGAKLVNVCTAEIQEGIDVAVCEGRIALVGDAKHCIGDDTVVIDAKGQYLAPGFMDGHIHVESSMIGVGEYARAVVPHGTTAIFACRSGCSTRSDGPSCRRRTGRTRCSRSPSAGSGRRRCWRRHKPRRSGRPRRRSRDSGAPCSRS